jgi:alpha-tubulin suppressor-like RCC1 family protein
VTPDTSRLIRVPFFDEKLVVAISCGSLHSSAVTLDGLVYTWGSNTRQ